MESFRDALVALRGLIGRPAFSALAVLSMALGFGAAIAILSVADAVLLRALPYPSAERLVAVREVDAKGKSMPLADANYRDLRAGVHGLDAIAQYGGGTIWCCTATAACARTCASYPGTSSMYSASSPRSAAASQRMSRRPTRTSRW